MAGKTDRHVIVAAPFVGGETAPLLRIASELHVLGHQVTMVAASRFAEELPSGIEFAPLWGRANLDDRRWTEDFPERSALPPVPDRLNHDFSHGFIDPMPDEYAQLQELLRRDPEARLIANSFYLGAWPVALGAPGRRPRTWVSVVANPLTLSSDDTTYFGPSTVGPGESAVAANRAANAAFTAMLSPTQQHLAEVLRGLGATASPPPFLDGLATMADACAVLSVIGMEFARGDAPASLHHVGLLSPAAPGDWRAPSWWRDLGGPRPVVVVTQGTAANNDLTELVMPSIEALADRDVLVVVALGRERSALPGPVPDNVRVAEFIPFSVLLPRVDLLVTNGGYGGTQAALAAGVPVVVGGATEDKPATAARVARNGLGVDLGTSRPTVEQIGDAADRVLGDPQIHSAVRELAQLYAAHDAVTEIERLAFADPGPSTPPRSPSV